MIDKIFKNNKRIPAIFLIALMIFSVLGCQKTSYNENSGQNNGARYGTDSQENKEDVIDVEETDPEEESESKEETDVKDDSETEKEDVKESEKEESESLENEKSENTENTEDPKTGIEENGEYSSKDEVALYIHTYGHLPSNFITKNEAKNLGWDSSKGNLWEVAPGKSIGGDKFGNREGLLPKADKRQYYECDIDFDGGYRNEKRIIYSNDGLIYYTGDHYSSFTQLY